MSDASNNSRAVALSIALLLAMTFEGVRYVAYKPTPDDVWTICYGDTQGVKPGDTATPTDCVTRLRSTMDHALSVVDANVKVQLTPQQRGALADFVYNEGDGRFLGSTMLRQFNAGQITAGCVSLIDWRLQHDAVLPGLVARREEELKYCLGVKS